METKAIKCDHCGHVHEASAKTFVTVQGNVSIGESGGIVGNNLRDVTSIAGNGIQEAGYEIYDVKTQHFCVGHFLQDIATAAGIDMVFKR